MTPTSEDNARNSVNGVLGLGKPMTLTSGGDALLTACTLSSSDSGGVLLEKCGNPLCREVLEPKKRRAHVKLYMVSVRQRASMIRRVTALLEKLPDDEALKVLRVMSVSAALSRHI
jgi:hypothetical protein